MCGFSLKKSAWELELSKCITVKLYPSLRPAGMIIVCGDSHIIFVLCALLYWRQPSSPAEWGKKHLSANLWPGSAARCRAGCRRRGSGDAAAVLPDEQPLVSRELCSLKHGRTEKVETKGWHLKTHISLLLTSSKFALVQNPPQQLHFSPTPKSFVWCSLLLPCPSSGSPFLCFCRAVI